MRLLVFFKKAIIETIRDWKVLVMAIIFGPLFVGIFHVVFDSKATSYNVLIYNSDISVSENNTNYYGSEGLIKQLKSYENEDGSPLYNLYFADDLKKGQEDVRNKKYDVFLSIPESFSRDIVLQKNNADFAVTRFTIYGDLTYQKYIVSAIFLNAATEEFINHETGKVKSYVFEEVPLKALDNITDFDAAQSTAIFIGIIMLLFTSAIALIKEVDSGTIRRLQISKLKSFEFLMATSLVQMIIGVVGALLTLGVGVWLFGAVMKGTFLNVFIVSVVTCLPVIAIGLIIAGVSRNIVDIMIIGNLPYFVLLIFSGSFPIPRVNLFYLGGHAVALNDIFATTPAVTALNKVMLEGATLGQVGFELGLIGVLTVVYFIVGVWLFNRKHMRLS